MNKNNEEYQQYIKRADKANRNLALVEETIQWCEGKSYSQLMDEKMRLLRMRWDLEDKKDQIDVRVSMIVEAIVDLQRQSR